ncbi:MAG: M15 family metallopeptidase, partial [Bradyrhizobium sp.]
MKIAVILAAVAGLVSPVLAQGLPGDFAFLRDIDPTIIQDIRYAGANNFMGRPIAGYDAAECVVKREVGLRLKAVQRELARQKLSLKMFDCYRPARAVADMVAWSRNGKETAAERRYNPAFSKADLFRLGYIATHSGHST